jgi:hypothetical protein
MPFFQRLFAALLSKSSMDALEADSRDWMVVCPCGHERSIWDIGGIRYGGRSTGKRTLIKCPKCGKHRWHRFYRKSVEQAKSG